MRNLEPELTVNFKRLVLALFLLCLSFELLFVWLDYYVNYSKWTTIGPMRRLTNITREDGIATWFAVTQTLLVGLTCWFILAVSSAQKDSTPQRLGWLILALFFTYMAADDGAQIHERIGSTYKIMNERAGEESAGISGMFPSYAWQIVVLPVFAGLGLFMLFFMMTQLTTLKLRAAMFVGCGLMAVAVGLDFIEGLDFDSKLNIYADWAANEALGDYTMSQFDKRPYEAIRHFSKSVEEFLEMLAITTLWCVFLSHLGQRARGVKLNFVSK